MKYMSVILSVILILALGCTQQTPPANVTNNTSVKACTEEAKICPDGSAVGRTGPNCTFAPCPSIVGNDTDAHGCKPSAGYSWCEAKQKCIRPFEEPCEATLPLYTVKTSNTSLGELLIDGNGFTLYTFSPDSVNKSTCTGSCVSNWPPLLVKDTISIPNGLPGTIGAFARMDNLSEIQVTYNGMPLYTYAADSAPGDTNGQGIGGKWYVVKVSD
jgi:predicted lipoprotein with Yx(FWY)xxD motif